MDIVTKQLKLEELSDLKYEVHIGDSEAVKYCKIMILKFVGEYGYGSGGNSDAIYMCAIGKAVLEAWEPAGLILDFSELTYEWGDQLEDVFYIGEDQYRNIPFPVALIVGERSEEAIRTLILGVYSDQTTEDIDWVHRDLNSAWTFIEEKLTEYDRNKRL
ncbi:hypothetical protein NKT34_18390 [Paenibacillus polysaccharolyticus]|uniref:hypothetical protein n=1 Tax=Paenibacillus polysaccharolyticus TaxID=582692 RepID=UPI0020A22CE6|nr:hypothetical protein [Paenibacillus polysaccharolyticus]MCP1135273.1 hypothetical protein [Paenibacillus polysaccharolyticus]